MHIILDSVRTVAEQSQHVKINTGAIDTFSGFDIHQRGHWLQNTPFDMMELSRDEMMRYLLVFNSISFSYWGDPKWEVLYRGQKYDGTWGMIACLNMALSDGVPLLQSDYLRNLTTDGLEDVLAGNVQIPLLDERRKILNEIGEGIDEFPDMVENSTEAWVLFRSIVSRFDSFHDIADYNGKGVFFYKRGQLLVSDIHQLRNLRNISQLTACADYKIPQVLRRTGILEYSDELARRVDNGICLAPGSGMEVEIRANTIMAVELIKQRLSGDFPGVTSREINDYLWLEGQRKLPGDKPYHRTRTIAY